MAVCSLRIAVNTRPQGRCHRRRRGLSSRTTSTITVWNSQGENCAQYLAKGRPVRRHSPRVARVGCAGRHEAPGRRADRRHRAVPRRPAAAVARAAAATSSCRGRDGWLDTRTSKTPTTTLLPETLLAAPRTIPIATAARAGVASARPLLGPGRLKSCFFCKSKVDREVDYKNINELRRYVSEKGKIRNRRISGACRRHQRQGRGRGEARASFALPTTSGTSSPRDGSHPQAGRRRHRSPAARS